MDAGVVLVTAASPMQSYGEMNVLSGLGGEVGQDHERGINFLHKLAVGFGLVAHSLPFGIVAESLPVGGCGIATGVREDVHKSFALEGFVGGRPVGHVFYSMLLEEFSGVIAKATQQVVQFAVVGVINAEFVDRCHGWSKRGFFLSRGEPASPWEQC